jgi:hypothetical protein
MNTTKLVQEAPYHPGYEDAVIEPAFAYKGVDPSKMIWKPKPLSEEEILKMASDMFHYTEYRLVVEFARAIEQRHGIK